MIVRYVVMFQVVYVIQHLCQHDLKMNSMKIASQNNTQYPLLTILTIRLTLTLFLLFHFLLLTLLLL